MELLEPEHRPHPSPGSGRIAPIRPLACPRNVPAAADPADVAVPGSPRVSWPGWRKPGLMHGQRWLLTALQTLIKLPNATWQALVLKSSCCG